MLKTMLNAYQPPKRTPNNAVFFASWEISNDAAADTFTTFDFDNVVVLARRLKEDAAKSLLFPNKEEEEVNELDDDDLLGEFIIIVLVSVVLGRAQRHDRLLFDPAKEEDERCVWWWVVANMMTMMMIRRSVSSSHCVVVCFVSVLVWIKWKNKRKKQLSEYQRQCHVFLTNESLVRQEKSPHAEKTLNRGVKMHLWVGGVKSFFRLVPIFY